MNGWNEEDHLVDELARLNPVDERDLVGVVPDAGHDALPALIMAEQPAAEAAPVPARRWRGGVFEDGLAARGVFIGAVACVVALIVALNVLAFGRVGDRDAVRLDPVAPTGGDARSAEPDGGIGDPVAVPGVPEASDTDSDTDTDTGPATAEVTTTEEVAADDTDPPTSPSTSASPSRSDAEEAPTTTVPEAPEPCTAEGLTLTKAVVAYRDACSEPRADCDPVGEGGRWVCSSEIIGVEGPSSSWG